MAVMPVLARTNEVHPSRPRPRGATLLSVRDGDNAPFPNDIMSAGGPPDYARRRNSSQSTPPVSVASGGPLRVVQILEATQGGTGRHLEEITLGLLARGVEVHVVCAARRDPAYREVLGRLRGRGAEVTELELHREIRPLRDVVGTWRLRRLLRRDRCDVVHAHSSKAGALGRVAARLAGIRAIAYTPHAFAFLDRTSRRRALYLRVERFLGRGHTDLLVAVSESERDVAIEHGIVAPSRAVVVRNGVDARAVVPRQASADVGAPVSIGFLGRLEPQKGPERLLGLAAELDRRGLRYELHVVGAGSLAGRCRRDADRAGATQRVRFHGAVADPSTWYPSLDLFVSTSSFEGLPYAVLDAMAWSLPVIGFDVPGVRDAVADGTTGLLVPPFDVATMAEAIATLAVDRERRLLLGRRGRERVETRFRLDRQIEALHRHYLALAAVAASAGSAGPARSRSARTP
jgi:glycosyltransferase involved in cell wall biosynthesis